MLAAYILQQGINSVEVSQCLQLVVKPFGHARVPFLDADGGVCSHLGASCGGKIGSRVEAQFADEACSRYINWYGGGGLRVQQRLVS